LPWCAARIIFDLTGKKLYTLKGVNIYRPSGELVGHVSVMTSHRPATREAPRCALIAPLTGYFPPKATPRLRRLVEIGLTVETK
jgi:hypothetical protein